MATAKQIGLIHGLAKRAGLDDDARRDVLRQVAGVGSSRDLSIDAAGRVIDRLKFLAGDDPARQDRPKKGGAEGALALAGPFVGKLRALWLTAWNLGLTEARTDTALAAFVARQTGIDSPSWVRDPADARKAIEGLKAWIARESGLVWPKDGRDARLLKWTLARRQWEILIEGGMPIRLLKWSDLADYAAAMIGNRHPQQIRPTVSMTLAELDEPQLDALAAALGAKIRKTKGRAR